MGRGRLEVRNVVPNQKVYCSKIDDAEYGSDRIFILEPLNGWNNNATTIEGDIIENQIQALLD